MSVPQPQLPDGTVYGRGGAVATSHPLAVEVGSRILQDGGNAVDAAVAMAATLTVVEPTSNGIGSDAFALVWAEGKLHGLNGSGRSPAMLTADHPALRGAKSFPTRGWLPVTVPGAPAAWHDLHTRFGKLPFDVVLDPAVRIADQGHPVAPLVAMNWNRVVEAFGAPNPPEMAAWRTTFMRSGSTPRAGELWRAPDHARTLEAIAASGSRAFYTGDLALAMDAFSRETGGLLRAEDLAAHSSEWVEPLSARYRDAELWEIPPNGQGIVALQALRLLDGFPAPRAWNDLNALHQAIEAIKLGFADAQAQVADPSHMRHTPEVLLEEDYITGRRTEICGIAQRHVTGLPQRGGTVYLVAADASGMMVSFIQSNFMGFGSGVVVPGTGIALQNRGAGFSLQPGHPNQVGASKRPFHTIIPGFLTRAGKPWGPMGVMGGHMQPQGHVQVVRALVDLGLTPQAALDLPRWHWSEGLRVELERGWGAETSDYLSAHGHEVTAASDSGLFGRGQIILREEQDILAAGSERRCDGRAVAW